MGNSKVHGKRSKGKGLDIGTSFIHCAERNKNSIIFRTVRNAFFDIEHTDFSKAMLDRSRANYIQRDNRLFVVGDEALGFANIFNKEARRPLSRGVISPQEKDALPMMEIMTESVLGPPRHKGEIVYYSVPGDPVDTDFNITYHKEILSQILSKHGYTPKPINEGLAVILAELDKDNFTGIGMSFGGGMVNVCLGFVSVPIFQFSISKSGDWIDRQVAMALDETASKICATKEKSFSLSKKGNLSKIEEALKIYYDNLIEYVLRHLANSFKKTKEIPQFEKPINIVISGGTSLPKGFLDRFKSMLRRIELPIEIGKIGIAKEPRHSVCKGALITAVADEEKKQRK